MQRSELEQFGGGGFGDQQTCPHAPSCMRVMVNVAKPTILYCPFCPLCETWSNTGMRIGVFKNIAGVHPVFWPGGEFPGADPAKLLDVSSAVRQPEPATMSSHPKPPGRF